MFKLRTQLQNRLICEFFGSKVSENLKFFPTQIQKEFKINAINSYQRSFIYVRTLTLIRAHSNYFPLLTWILN